MKYTRRGFLEARGSRRHLGGGGCSRQPATVTHLSGASGVELGVGNAALPDYWDGIRGIDLLLTRAEVDPERIGCCGQSGGGTLTPFQEYKRA
jgi:hypothetical protein